MRKGIIFFVVMLVAGMALAQNRPNLLNRRGLGGINQPRNGAAPNAQKQASQPQMTREDLKTVPRGTNGVPALAFNQAPLDLVLEAYAAEVGKTIIPAPDLPKATITLRSLEDQVLTKSEYLEAIEVTLTMNGVVLEPRGEKFLRALPRKTVRTHGIPLLLHDKGNLPEQGRVVSQMIQFKNIEVTEAQKALEGFKAPEGLFQVFERTNAILVTDTQENINRMLEVVRAIDIATPVTEDVFVRQIEYALATDIKTHLEEIVRAAQEESQKKQSGPKQSGAPGFGSSTPPPLRTGLLNLNNRPGAQPQQQAPAANANLIAAVSDADRGMIRGKVLILADERSNKLIIITSKANMDFFDKVIKTLDVETTPEVQIEVIRLKYAEAEDVEQMLNDLIGASGNSSQNKNNQNANTQKGGAANSNLTRGTTAAQTRRPGAANSPTFQNANASRLGELNKDNVKVLADKRINGIVVMARKADMRAIREVIDNMDVKLSQVLIETVIIEVRLGDGLKTGIDWIQRGRAKTWVDVSTANGFAEDRYYLRNPKGVLTSTAMSQSEFDALDTTSGGAYDGWSISDVFQKVSRISRGDLVNNGNYALGGGGNGLANAGSAIGQLFTNGAEVVGFGGMTPVGAGVNYFLKSDKLNLSAIIQASKNDSRAKYLASPIIMTVDNKEATIDATENRQFLTGWSAVSGYNGSGMPSPNYSAKDIGIKIKVTPKINPNGTVMLTVEEEYSQYMENGQSMLIPSGTSYTPGYVDLAVERKMSADVRLENMQTVVFGGMTKTTTSESEAGIPILKDIPWIGKWLFGSVSIKEARSELLVFITPYVLDDAAASQAEALRRKKVLSDPRPWDDNGWSRSALADPVSKKEQLRRQGREWASQDEEHETGKRLEEAKEQRVKELEEKADKERREWAEKHAKDVLEALKRHEQSEIDWSELIDKLRREKEEREAAEKQKKLSEAKVQESTGESAPDAAEGKGK